MPRNDVVGNNQYERRCREQYSCHLKVGMGFYNLTSYVAVQRAFSRDERWLVSKYSLPWQRIQFVPLDLEPIHPTANNGSQKIRTL